MTSEVTTRDFIRFLNATRANSSCPGCGLSPSKWALCTDSWQGNKNAKSVTIMESLFHRFRQVREEDGKPYGVSTFVMFCQNCGHVEHIYQPIVMEWIANNTKEPSNGSNTKE